MNQRLTRRRLGQLAIAVTTLAGLNYLANKTFAQTQNLMLIGVSIGTAISFNDAPTELDNPDVDSDDVLRTTILSTPRQLVLQSLDVVTGQVQLLTIPQFLEDGTPILESNEQLSGFTSLLDGTLVVAITPVSTSNNENTPTRLTILSTPPKAVTVSGLNQQEALQSLLVTNDGGLMGIVLKKNSTPPVRLVDIDIQTGKIAANGMVQLPNNQRFITLSECPDGTIYTITTGQDGNTNLVKLDQEQKQAIILGQLSLNGSDWNNGLHSLVCSGAGQLLALGAPRYESPNSVYSVDMSNGNMTALTPFDVVKFTIAR